MDITTSAPENSSSLTNDLTPQQHAAAMYIASCRTITDTAGLIGVSRETVSRWKRNPRFIAQINSYLNENQLELQNRLTRIALRSLDVLEEFLMATEDPSVPLNILKTVELGKQLKKSEHPLYVAQEMAASEATSVYPGESNSLEWRQLQQAHYQKIVDEYNLTQEIDPAALPLHRELVGPVAESLIYELDDQ